MAPDTAADPLSDLYQQQGATGVASAFLPPSFTGQSSTQQKVTRAFRKQGPFGGLLSTVTNLPGLAGDVAHGAFDFSEAGLLHGLPSALQAPFRARGTTRVAALGGLALAALGARKAVGNVRAGFRPNLLGEAGNLAFLPQVGENPVSEMVRRRFPYDIPDAQLDQGIPAQGWKRDLFHPVSKRFKWERPTTGARFAATRWGDLNELVDTFYKPAAAVAGDANRLELGRRQLAGFFDSTGRRLGTDVDLHRTGAGVVQGGPTPVEEAAKRAAGHEMTKLANLAHGGGLDNLPEMKAALTHTLDGRATPAQMAALQDFVVEFAGDTQHILDPELKAPGRAKLVAVDRNPDGGLRHFFSVDTKNSYGPKAQLSGIDMSSLHDEMVDNILTAFLRSQPENVGQGLHWYQDAHDMTKMWSKRYGVSHEVAAGVMAAMSPNMSWEENIRLAETFLANKGEMKGGMLGVSLDRARRIYNGEPPTAALAPKGAGDSGGHKVFNFYTNIIDPQRTDAVTVDRHAFDVAMGYVAGVDKPPLDRASDYAAVAQAYRTAAKMMSVNADVLPQQVQALTWEDWRVLKKAGHDQAFIDPTIKDMLAANGALEIPYLSSAVAPSEPLDEATQRLLGKVTTPTSGLVLVGQGDGPLAAYGRISEETKSLFRNLHPQEVPGVPGGYVSWVPDRTVGVDGVSDHLDRLLAHNLDGRGKPTGSGGRVYSSAAIDHLPGARPGYHILVTALDTASNGPGVAAHDAMEASLNSRIAGKVVRHDMDPHLGRAVAWVNPATGEEVWNPTRVQARQWETTKVDEHRIGAIFEFENPTDLQTAWEHIHKTHANPRKAIYLKESVPESDRGTVRQPEDVLDTVAYVNGEGQRPFVPFVDKSSGSPKKLNAVRVWEHHFSDDSGGHLVHMSSTGAPTNRNNHPVWVHPDYASYFSGGKNPLLEGRIEPKISQLQSHDTLYGGELRITFDPTDAFKHPTRGSLMSGTLNGSRIKDFALYLPTTDAELPALSFGEQAGNRLQTNYHIVDPTRIVFGQRRADGSVRLHGATPTMLADAQLLLRRTGVSGVITAASSATQATG